MIELRAVSKSFAALAAVQSLDLIIPGDRVMGILGPNGAGKTTTIRMICGLLPPSSGTITLGGFDTVAQGRSARRLIGYLPESAPLPPEMRVVSYLRYRAGLYDLSPKRASKAIEGVLERCWLADRKRQRIGTLSKGYRQRVGLAAALLHDPKVLILDEPTSGLDPSQIAETRNLIRDLAQERTTILVSHILPEVERTCDRIAIIARGKMVAEGTPAELIARNANHPEFSVEYRTTGPIPETLVPGAETLEHTNADASGWRRLTIRSSDPRAAETLGESLSKQGAIIRELTTKRATLEDVFLKVTTPENVR